MKRHKLIEIISERKQSKIRDVMESWGEEILAGVALSKESTIN
jgi:hypothetical protein